MQQRRNQIKKKSQIDPHMVKDQQKKTKTKKKLMRRPTQKKKNGQADQNTHVLQSSDAKLVAHTLTKKTQTDQKKKFQYCVKVCAKMMKWKKIQ